MVCFKYIIVYTLHKHDKKDDDDDNNNNKIINMYVRTYTAFIPGQYYYVCGCVHFKYYVSKSDVNFIASVDSRMFHRE